MNQNPDRRRVLVVGNDASVARAGIPPDTELEVELVGSLAEAAEKQASGCYARVIFDPAAFKGARFEILADARLLDYCADDLVSPQQTPHQTASKTEQILDIVNERKRQDQALRVSEERFRTIFDKAAIGITTVNLDGSRIMTCNPALQQMLGYDANELTTKSLIDITHPEDIEEDLAQLSDLIAGKIDHFHMEKRYIRKDGSIIWGHLTGTVVFDADKNPLYAIGMVEDITERKLAEEELQILAQRLNSHMENSPLAVVEWDPDYRVIRWSDEAQHVFGWSAEEMLGKRIDEVRWVYEEDWPIVVKLMEDMNAGIRPRNVNPNRNYCKDGSIIHCEWYNSVLWDSFGRVTSILSLVLDVTKRERAEQALRESREDLNRAQAVAQTGSWRLDVRRNELLWSDETYRMFGIAKGTPLTYEAFLATVHPEDREYVDRKWNAALRGEPYDIEHRIVVGGSVEWVRERAELEFDQQGQLLGGFGTVQDITDRKKAEQEQKELLHREQHIASTLQQALVPPSVPEEINGYRFAVKYKPALREAEIGGDFYDVFDLGDGRVCVMIGDVAGKGLRAAMRVAAARYAIRGCAFIEAKPSRILALANESLCCGTEEEQDMLTAFLALIDTRVGSVIFSNAGHEPPLLLHPDGRTEELLTAGTPLGIMPGISYSEGTCRFDPGSRIVMFTDGIIEARTPSVELFGKHRVIDYVRYNSKSPLQDVVDGLLQTAAAHAGGELQDDAAIVVIERMR